MIKITQTGKFEKTTSFLSKCMNDDIRKEMDMWGRHGVTALSAATPKDTGNTASSWSYSISETKDGYKLCWSNSNINKGVNIAVILQYGHATRNGGWVSGNDYINPALRPVYDEIETYFKRYF